MGLTGSSVGRGALREKLIKRCDGDIICALTGTPNVGKSSLFNALTGLDQHTGNWTGKTVVTAVGYCEREKIIFADLPGTYSLRSGSPEEEVARDYIKSGEADVICVVVDALCLERGLSLALCVLELTARAVVCVNLADEAEKRGVFVDTDKLSSILGVPVVLTSAKRKRGLSELCRAVRAAADKDVCDADSVLRYSPETEAELKKLTNIGYSRDEVIEAWLSEGDMPDDIAEALKNIGESDLPEVKKQLLSRPIIISEAIANEVVSGRERAGYSAVDRKIDRAVMHPILSLPLMLLMLAAIFYLTAVGANYPSAMLGAFFDKIEVWLYDASDFLPHSLREMLISGGVRTLFRVVSVMLPPMAIFFPLFTILEDVGLLGRIAFNLDGAFCRASTCGKQALTMCMGIGCNAAGVVGCRIIDSPRERIIAVLTNSFMPCNGRFPILFTMAALLFSGVFGGIGTALVLTCAVALGAVMTLGISKLLSLTLLKGKPSSFILELPSYRVPNVMQVLVRSVFDRTLLVLGRAAAVALPAGLVIWLLANVDVFGYSLLWHLQSALDPIGRFIGLDGAVLCAFMLAFPANEIVLPIVLMCYTASGSLGSDFGIGEILAQNGWTAITYINMMILTVFHFPCSTTVLTVKKETGSIGYALLSMLIPTAIGFMLCALTNAAAKLF